MPEVDWTTMRPPTEVAAAHDRVLDSRTAMLAHDPSFELGERYTRGQLAALSWVLGTAERSPLTNRRRDDPPDAAAVASEQYLATDMLYRQVEMDRRGHHYVSGVEVALMWVRHQTDSEL